MICSPAAFTAQRNAIMLSSVGRALVCLALLFSRHVVLCMLHKNKRPYNPAVLTSGQRLVENVKDIFGQNQLSGKRTQEVCNDVARCGIGEFKKLKGAQGSHASGNLTRKFLKRCQWPDKYWAQCRVLNKRTHAVETQWVAFILPHEYLAKLVKYGDLDLILRIICCVL